MNQDFKAFQTEISWFIGTNSKVEFEVSKEIRLSEEFRTTFPELTGLILKSRQTYLKIDDINYILFAWDSKEGEVCGWLNQQETVEEYKHELIEKHELLLRNIGGIRESFNQPEGSFTNNKNFIFIGSECSRGIGDWDDYYSMMCEDEGKTEIDYSTFLTFSHEVNGDLTLYEPVAEELYLFSHDHSFENVDFVKDQPEYTFHTFKNINTFGSYVEELARQWKEVIDLSQE